MSKSNCDKCWFHAYAERKPNSILARLWRWHTTWCPGWKKYQQQLTEQDEKTPAQSDTSGRDNP